MSKKIEWTYGLYGSNNLRIGKFSLRSQYQAPNEYGGNISMDTIHITPNPSREFIQDAALRVFRKHLTEALEELDKLEGK